MGKGQSPIPERDPHHLAGSVMATAVFDRGRSAASWSYLGHITRWAYWDSRRYRERSTAFGERSLTFAANPVPYARG
jgi:hypothetical protein